MTKEEEIKTVIAGHLDHFGYQLCTLHKAEQVEWPCHLTQRNMSVPTRINNLRGRYVGAHFRAYLFLKFFGKRMSDLGPNFAAFMLAP